MKVFILMFFLSTPLWSSTIKLGGLEDLLGNGTLIKNGKYIESEVCAIRNITTARGSQSIEFDFLGDSNIFPNDFDLTNRELSTRSSETGITYIKKLSKKGYHIWGKVFSRYVCPTGLQAEVARLELTHENELSITIAWIAECSDDQEYFLSLRCTDSSYSVLKN